MPEYPPKFADARTLEGKLQRGLGTGFLEALAAPREQVHEILEACMQSDPRLEHQIDSRDWYYGELAFRTRLPVDRIAGVLKGFGADDEEGDGWIALSVLEHLVRRGVPGAEAVLRDYVTWGYWGDDVISELGAAAATPEWEPVAGTVIARALAGGHRGAWSEEPFLTWAKANPDAARLVERTNETIARAPGSDDWRTWPTSEILRGDKRSIPYWRFVGAELASRTSPSDRSVVAEAVRNEHPWVRAVAVLVQATQGEFGNLPVALEIAMRRQRPRWISAVARDAMVLAPAEIGLPLARALRSSRKHLERLLGWKLLGRHATADDLPWLRRQMRRANAENPNHSYWWRSLAEIIAARFPGTPFPSLGRKFDQFTYSFGRQYLAAALAVTDTSFPASRAFTSLWDCESGVRQIAVEHVDLTIEGARERLREMATDELESELVRAAAAARLELR